MVRNSVKFVPWKEYKAVSSDLKKIYQSATEEEALLALEEFAARWDDKYPQISRSWQAHWHNLNALFSYPEDIRRAIYTTNAIESLNSVIRKAIKKRKLPYRRICQEGHLPGDSDSGSIKKVDNANPKLETCDDKIHDPVRGATDRSCLTSAVTQKYLHPRNLIH